MASTLALELTAPDLRALRQARDWAIWHRRDGQIDKGYGSQPLGLLVARTGAADSVWSTRDGDDLIREIPVFSSITDYTDWNGPTDFERAKTLEASCSWVMDSVRKTIAKSLRVGDWLSLEWIYNNHSQLMQQYGVGQDMLLLHVSRGGATRALTFLVHVETTYPGLSRMIRPERSRS